MKKIIIYPTKTFIVIRENHFQKTPITLDSKNPLNGIIEKITIPKKLNKFLTKHIVDQIVKLVNIEITNQDQIQTNLNFRLMPVPIQIQEIEIIQIIDLETLHIIEKEILPMIGIETIQLIEILDIKLTDHAVILTTDQTITDQNRTIIKLNHAIIHGIEIQL